MAEANTDGQLPTLRRELGLFETVVYGVGLILGAGIYAILGEAAGLTGGSVAVSFQLAAAIAALTGLSYAELASIYPRGEGDYVYVRAAFGSKRLSEFTALCRVFMGVISAAALALPFVLIGDIGRAAGLANLVLLVVFVLVNAALLKLRFDEPDAERGFRAPLNAGRLSLTALGGLLSCLGLIVFYLSWLV